MKINAKDIASLSLDELAPLATAMFLRLDELGYPHAAAYVGIARDRFVQRNQGKFADSKGGATRPGSIAPEPEEFDFSDVEFP